MQKEKKLPLNYIPDLNVRSVSVDGDADRNVFFYNGDNGFNLVDGDK